MATVVKRWNANSEDNNNLAKLFKEGKLDPKHITTKDIKKAHSSFPHTTYTNFAVLYKGKCNQWNLEQDLSGSRKSGPSRGSVQKGGNRHKKATTGTIEDFLHDNGEDDDDFEVGEADNEDDDDDAEDIDSGDEEVVAEEAIVEETSKRRARKKAAAKKKAEDEEILTEQLSKMSVSKKPYCMDIPCPHIMYDYVDYGNQIVTIDFLVPNQHRRHFRLQVKDNKTLELKVVVPDIFYDPVRLLAQYGHKSNFNKNSAKATAFQSRCKAIKKKEGAKVEKEIAAGEVEEITEVYSSVQSIELPFAVEEELYTGHRGKAQGYEVFLLNNDDEVLAAEMGDGGTEFSVLSVDMKKMEDKPKKKPKGSMRRVVIVNRKTLADKEDTDSEAEDEAEGEGGGMGE